MALGLLFIYVPLMLVLVNSFNGDRTFGWPPHDFTTRWWSAAWDNAGAREALLTSVKAGLGATAIALSLLIVLPIALPGIVTGIALDSAWRSVIEPLGIGKGLFSVIVGHATFCVVTIYNNVLARLRRTGTNLEDASADLGASPGQTFRYVTFPLIRSALLAGGLLAFALSFDEIIVTTFTAGTEQTLPIWIFANFRLPNQRPIVNVVALGMILLSLVPVYISARLAGAESVASAR
jgi:putative spermidine/putrescine transport system permease protein